MALIKTMFKPKKVVKENPFRQRLDEKAKAWGEKQIKKYNEQFKKIN